MRGRRRRGRDRFVVGATITLLVAGGVTSGFVLAYRTAGVILTAQHTSIDTNKHAVPAPPANFDHFDFSSLWLAVNHQPSLPIHGQAAYLVDLDTRQVMWARDPETSRAPASLTKLITAMVAVDDAGSLDRTVVVAKEAVQVVPSVMGLSAGESLTVRQLLDGLFLDSGNDAAEALARGIVPRDRFIRQMNQKAKSIGLTASHFVNPSGLDAPGHGMSAHDLAHAAAYLDQYYPELANIAATRDVRIPATGQHKAFYPHNLNQLIYTYPGATGLKTGLTDNAGGCIVATATRNGRHLIAVVLNATLHSAADATVLLNYGFSTQPRLPLLS
ncbi:MAG TPA: D-alanyl-D-alanine carboxypeptidase [Chloroflexi bacterium]|jgi:D-alanyl-D-alanine carboxypeptidase|nr:D-alanyl-D-alanine carboxypeptidase [Chloroflexota bacterium]HAF19556.1 D-alanyl-D-alanine carboxypeptidase [Chloroflexota bacterium]